MTYSESRSHYIWGGEGSAVTDASVKKQRQSDHPVSVHGEPTWQRCRATVSSARGLTLHSASIKAKGRRAILTLALLQGVRVAC